MSAQITASVFGALASMLLGGIVQMLRGMRRDVKAFMAEHLYLLSCADWAVDTIESVMTELGVTLAKPPPAPPRHKRNSHV